MPPPPQQDGGALTSMILGICGILLCTVLAPVALFMGISARRRIRQSAGYLIGDGLATAGIVLGVIGTVILALAIIGLIVLVVIATATAHHG